MQLDYYDPGLAGFSLKKAFKKIGKGLKKVVKPALHIGAAVFTGGTSLALSASMLKAKQEQKAQAALQKSMIAAQVGPIQPITQLAPSADSIMTRLPMPTYGGEGYYGGGGGGGGGYFPGPQSDGMMTTQQRGATPEWVVPVAAAGAAVVLLTLLSNRRQS